MKYIKTEHENIKRAPNGFLYYVRGKKEISLKTKDAAEALKRKRVLLAKGGDVLTSSTRLKIADVAEDYLKERKIEHNKKEIRAYTLLHTQKNMAIIVKLQGKVAVTKFDIGHWDLIRQKITGNHIFNVRIVLSHFLKWCVRKKYRTTVLMLNLPKIKRRKRRILSPPEIQALWSHATGNFRVFFGLALVLGLRRSEAMLLEWSQIRFETNSIYLGEEKTKTDKDRWVTLPPQLSDILKSRLDSQLAAGIQTQWVFPHKFNSSRHADRDGLKTAWHTCLRRAYGVSKEDPKPNVTWHDLRATCEFYAHKRTDVSATQLEKYFGADVDVQRRIYVQGDMEFVRGVENPQLLQEFKPTGKTPESEK